MAHPGGRPKKWHYSKELADKICDAVSVSPYSLRHIIKSNDLPDINTINRWRLTIPEFCDAYVKAKQLQMDTMTDFCLDISDDSLNDTLINKDGNEVANNEYIARSRLRVDTRKWLAAKLAPKIYGVRETKDMNVNVHEKSIDEV